MSSTTHFPRKQSKTNQPQERQLLQLRLIPVLRCPLQQPKKLFSIHRARARLPFVLLGFHSTHSIPRLYSQILPSIMSTIVDPVPNLFKRSNTASTCVLEEARGVDHNRSWIGDQSSEKTHKAMKDQVLFEWECKMIWAVFTLIADSIRLCWHYIHSFEFQTQRQDGERRAGSTDAKRA